jgi:HAD superfamily hydrolase (TIGR01484 family)
MIRLIVSDFDGTLMPYGAAGVSESVKELLQTAIDRGITVAVSSGRTYAELKALLPTLADSVYFIACDGAHYVKGGVSLYEKQIARPDLEIFASQMGQGLSCVFHALEKNYVLGELPRGVRFDNAVQISRVTELREKVFKITTFGQGVKLPAYCGLRTHWDGGPNAMAQYVNRFANKGAALSDLQVRLMCNKFDTAAIGDSGNDVVMMHNAKIAVAIGDKCKELTSVCNIQTDCIEHALAAILRAD